MSFVPQKGDAQVNLAVLGGLVTNMPASSLPEGVSPDNQDVVYLPGGVAGRPALKKVFGSALPAIGAGLVPGVVCGKSFITPTGGVKNLYLGTDGGLYWEDVLSTPGTYTFITQLAASSWGKSITAFGRAFLALSDGFHGTDVPLQWDGTNLDRVTQDGPGAPPNVATFSLPSVGMAVSGSVPLTLTEVDPVGAVAGNYSGLNVYTSSSVANVNPGDSLILSGFTGGQALMNNPAGWEILAVYPSSPSLIQVSAVLPATFTFWVPAQYAGPAGSLQTGTMVRKGNVVTVNCSTSHQLQVGYQAQIASVPAQVIGGGIAQIKIANTDNPGVATITTTAAHGLIPGLYVSIAGVKAAAVGGGVSSISRAGQVVTVVCSASSGLSPGAIVTIAGVTPASFNSTVQVMTVSTTTNPSDTFTFLQADTDATGSGGTISINWPIPNTATPSYFEVLASPTTTTFQVAISYSDGTWTTGSVSYAWNGTFFVTAILSTTMFQYQQYGPDASTGSTAGTVTPFGQAAPGIHQCQVLFLTRQGYATRPSPPVKFIASGGEFISVTNIPIGPPNIVARSLAFSGASGSTFFYIPSTPQVNGQIVGTSTQINDNASTAAVFDFSDPTLFAALGISIPGNNLANQIILDGALGFGFYGGRLLTCGQRNRIQNFLNMGFDGGYLPSATTLPAGWSTSATPGGSLAAGHIGQGWQASGAGYLFQPAYQDAYGAPILTAAAKYKFRAWVRGAATTATATIYSATTGFTSAATVSGTAAGGFAESDFSLATPSPIPADMQLILTWSGIPLIDELSIIYRDNPYTDTAIFASYDNNPEGFDGLSGKFGSTQDQRKVMDFATIRQTLCFLTQDPTGRLHEVSDNGITEPAGWTVNEIAANCGLLSAFGLAKSQADDSSAAGGEEWFAWCSSVGARIFGGGEPMEISREIYPDWQLINPAFQHLCWALNDPAARTMYFGLVLMGNPTAAPNRVYSLNYVGLDSATAIGTTGPVRIGFSGKRIATDHARKWTRWNKNVFLNGAALMFRAAGSLQPVFFNGNGTAINTLAASGQVFTLSSTQYTDDVYGQIYPYWVTSFLPGEEQEQAKELGGFRKLLTYLTAYVSSPVNCTLTITPYVDQLTKAWPITTARALVANPARDLETACGQAKGNRIALKFAVSPLASATDCCFNLQRLTAWFRKDARLPVGGSS